LDDSKVQALNNVLIYCRSDHSYLSLTRADIGNTVVLD